MGRHIKISFLGLLISFLGTLPFGTLNITAFHISAVQSIGEAMLFAFAVVAIELLVVRITLIGTNKIDFKSKWGVYVLPIAVVLLMYLSISSFISSGNHQEFTANSNVFPMIKSSIILGLLLSVLNPIHIPFWMGWNSVLKERRILDNKPGMYSSYIVGIGLGSIAGLMIFIFTGKYIFQNYQQYNYVIAFIMGCLYLGFSFYLLYLLYKNHLKLNIA